MSFLLHTHTHRKSGDEASRRASRAEEKLLRANEEIARLNALLDATDATSQRETLTRLQTLYDESLAREVRGGDRVVRAGERKWL